MTRDQLLNEVRRRLEAADPLTADELLFEIERHLSRVRVLTASEWRTMSELAAVTHERQNVATLIIPDDVSAEQARSVLRDVERSLEHDGRGYVVIPLGFSFRWT